MPFSGDLRILVLAPHPDDFDCVAVSLRHFHERGDRIDLAVLAGSASGVDDGFCSPSTVERKIEIREQEQRDSCALFGLPEDRIAFLRLAEEAGGHLVESVENFDAVRQCLDAARPGAVFLPHPHDTNPDHRRTYRLFRAAVEAVGATLVAFFNEDPKTIEMRDDVSAAFDDETAGWKAELLRCHRSQHERNLRTRGHGLDDRILSVNRMAAERCGLNAPYAELFEMEKWRAGQREKRG